MQLNNSFHHVLATAITTGVIVAAPLVYEINILLDQNKQLTYEKSQQEQEIIVLKNTIENPNFSSDKNLINTGWRKLNENEYIDLSSSQDKDKYIHTLSKQGVSIFLDLSSVEIKYNKPPIYEIIGTYYHASLGSKKATSCHTNLLRYDMETKTAWHWESKTNEWKILNVTGDTMVARGNRNAANDFFEAAIGTKFYK